MSLVAVVTVVPVVEMVVYAQLMEVAAVVI